jgi:hypothetical protein
LVFIQQTRNRFVCGWLYYWSDNILTPEFGFGMLVMGLIAIAIGAIIAYFIINKVHNENNTDN